MRILAALSGGVDSAVAAARLKAQGAEVIGIHLLTGVSSRAGEHARDAERIATHLEIAFRPLDVRDVFTRVVRDFVTTYAEGRTPNPCVDCNARVKFGRLLELAADLGCEAVATGHYARRQASAAGRWRLLRALDRKKDQSYVLCRLSPSQIAAARFPLGSSTKAVVRAEARALALPVAEKTESQDLCFLPEGDYRDFLRRHAPHALVPGEIVDHDGRVLGRHDGAAAYTVGQRRGLPAVGQPRYVTRVEGRSGRVHVAPRDLAHTREVRGSEVNWIDEDPPETGRQFCVQAKIRYASEPTPGSLQVEEGGEILLDFDDPAFAPTPGQALVAYRGDAVLCGATITDAR